MLVSPIKFTGFVAILLRYVAKLYSLGDKKIALKTNFVKNSNIFVEKHFWMITKFSSFMKCIFRKTAEMDD